MLDFDLIACKINKKIPFFDRTKPFWKMNIIITGASRGIGYELVKLFAKKSDNRIIAISRNQEKLMQLKQECLSFNSGSEVLPFVCDLNNAVSVKLIPEFVSEHLQTVDVLINNAGAIVNKPFAEITESDLQYVYSVNVFAVVRLIQSLLSSMNIKQRSHVVNISSMGGFQGSAKFSGLSAYSSSKAALACLTECLAEEFKERNIAFNCLALGAAQTEMLEEAFPGYKAPLTAAEMAEFIMSFSLDGQKHLNGKIIPVSMSTP
jgi:short-subunit dehydrogenase